MHGRTDCNAQEIYEPYELTVYENIISIRQGDDEKFGATVVWYSLSDIISFVEYQAEGYQSIVLLLPEADGLGNSLQDK